MENGYRPANSSGIGINAVEAAAMRRSTWVRRDFEGERLTQDRIDRILPYEDKDCCTD